MTSNKLTYCHDWCGTTTCEHHYSHTKPETPTLFFIDVPKNCTKWTPNEPTPKAA